MTDPFNSSPLDNPTAKLTSKTRVRKEVVVSAVNKIIVKIRR